MYFNILPVNGKNMVDAGVEENPVMRYQDEPLLGRKVLGDLLAGLGIQMIGRFIDEQEGVFL